jgi:2,4-dienoyl-CoA reductase-like NADH-dependent reductase (Old Yellow Enzyme family)
VPNLFDPIRVGDLDLPNRIFMAPLTRLRGTEKNVPRPELAAEYYAQRASAGLIITEGTPVDPKGVGYPQVPGIWSQEQTEAWKPIVEAIHEKGGRVFAQIWHVGRVSHSSYLDGEPPVAPSAIPPSSGNVSLIRPTTPFETPRALTIGEIHDVVEQFGRAAENAKTAGFDGVELHGANGYLLDQFLQSGSNSREDEYGGSVENRARLMLQAADAAVAVFGAGRVGMHLAPRSDAHGISDTNGAETFGYVATELGKRKLAFLMAREYEAADSLGPQLKKLFGGVYVANERFTLESGNAILERGDADGVAFGKWFIANPDLVRRLREGAPLNEARPELFYAHGAEGYSDYPALA